jgi:uncharacterized protein
LHTNFIKKNSSDFPQRFRSHSEGISGLGRKEKWRKAGGAGRLRKSGARQPSAVGRSPIGNALLNGRCSFATRVACTAAGARATLRMMPRLARADVRRLMTAHLGLTHPLASARAVLERLRCIQLDPLDVIGTNADLVVMARTEGVRRGDLWRRLFPRHAFEHFAKERCILPAAVFPYYRQQGHAAQPRWWRHREREERVPAGVVEAVLAEIRERGPVSARELTDHGSVAPIDWAGWMGTKKTTSMALEILWTRCEVVVCGRTSSGAKLFDLPERALGGAARGEPSEPFDRWALRERVTAAGLLSRAGSESWSMLSRVRTSSLPDEMIAAGALVDVSIEGSTRRYLTTPQFLAPRRVRYDDRVRILGPLDPLLWDRDLVRLAFDFDYVWEVYKPAHQRKWGWYVCPLLHRDRLIGRVDARVEGETLIVRKLWLDAPELKDRVAAALERHAELCGCRRVKRQTR